MAEAAEAIALAVQLIFHLMAPDPQPVFVSYYGTNSDGYAGQHHGAYWHGDSCSLPDVVDDIHFGAAAPRWIPYCLEIMICSADKCVVVMVVDRQRDDIIGELPHVDVWPAAAEYLGILDEGVGIFDMYVLSDDQDFLSRQK